MEKIVINVTIGLLMEEQVNNGKQVEFIHGLSMRLERSITEMLFIHYFLIFLYVWHFDLTEFQLLWMI